MPTLRSGRIVKRWTKRKPSANAKASKALSMVREIKRNIEKKFVDLQSTQFALGVAVTIDELTNIAQGFTQQTRVGDKITVTGIQLSYLITDTQNNTSRIMVVQDKQANGATYGANLLLEDTSAIDNIISPRDWDNKSRFRVLYDRVHTIASTGQNQAYVKKFIKCNIPIKYDLATATITALTVNSLSFVHFAAVAGGATGDITFFIRLYYTDN